MYRTKIETCDYTWNPVTGCLRGCNYCYARRIAKRFGKTTEERDFLPVFHPKRLSEPIFHASSADTTRKVFVCSMADLFGPWIEHDVIVKVLRVVRGCVGTFQFLTKYPERLVDFNPWPRQAWVGATATDDATMVHAMASLVHVEAAIRYIYAEPLLGPIGDFIPCFGDLNWLVIGGITGERKRRPGPAWVDELMAQADEYSIPVFVKQGLGIERKEWPR